jgi:hypothetical protein
MRDWKAMRKTALVAGSIVTAALLASGAASAQRSQPRQSYPADQDDLSVDDQPSIDEGGRAPERQANPAPRADDDFSDVVGQQEENRSWRQPGDPYDGRQDAPARSALSDEEEDAMTNCAIAGRDEAGRDGGYAEVRQMFAPRETRSGIDVEGDVEVRSGWRAQDGRIRHFTCTVQNGRVTDVWFRGDRSRR